eukprot:tig00001493_g8986.t1
MAMSTSYAYASTSPPALERAAAEGSVVGRDEDGSHEGSGSDSVSFGVNEASRVFQETCFGIAAVMKMGERRRARWVLAEVAFVSIQYLLFPLALFDWGGLGSWAEPVQRVLRAAVPFRLSGMAFGSFAALFYAACAAVALSLLTALHVGLSFARHRFSFIAPLKFLRVFVGPFARLLYMPLLSVFSATFNCGLPGPDGVSRHAYFEGVECWRGGHAGLAGAGGAAALAFTALVLLPQLLVFEDDFFRPGPDGRPDPLSRPHSRVDALTFACNAGLSCLANAGAALPREALPLAFTGSGALHVALFLEFFPYHRPAANAFFTALHAAFAYAALLCALQARYALPGLPYAMLAGLPAAAAAGAAASLARYRLAFCRPAAGPAAVQRLRRPLHIAARFAYERPEDPEAVEAAEGVYRAGLERFPASAAVLLAYAQFCAAFRRSPELAHERVRQAAALAPAFDHRFLVYRFTLQRQQEAQALAVGGDPSSDLIQHIEYTSNLQGARRASEPRACTRAFRPDRCLRPQFHRLASRGLRRFWSLVDVRALEETLARIDAAERRARAHYRALLLRHPRAPRILRAFGRFQAEVLNDEAAAAALFDQADACEARPRHFARPREAALTAAQEERARGPAPARTPHLKSLRSPLPSVLLASPAPRPGAGPARAPSTRASSSRPLPPTPSASSRRPLPFPLALPSPSPALEAEEEGEAGPGAGARPFLARASTASLDAGPGPAPRRSSQYLPGPAGGDERAERGAGRSRSGVWRRGSGAGSVEGKEGPGAGAGGMAGSFGRRRRRRASRRRRARAAPRVLRALPSALASRRASSAPPEQAGEAAKPPGPRAPPAPSPPVPRLAEERGAAAAGALGGDQAADRGGAGARAGSIRLARRALLASLAAVCAVAVGSFLGISALLDAFAEGIVRTGDSGNRRRLTYEAAFFAEDLLLAGDAAWDPAGTLEAASRARLARAADDMERFHLQARPAPARPGPAASEGPGQLSRSVRLTMDAEPSVPILALPPEGGGAPRRSLEPLWGAALELVSHARRVARAPLAELRDGSLDRELFFLHSNAVSLYGAFVAATAEVERGAYSSFQRIRFFLVGMFAGVSLLLAALALGVLRPTVAAVHREKQAALALFRGIPRALIAGRGAPGEGPGPGAASDESDCADVLADLEDEVEDPAAAAPPRPRPRLGPRRAPPLRLPRRRGSLPPPPPGRLARLVKTLRGRLGRGAGRPAGATVQYGAAFLLLFLLFLAWFGAGMQAAAASEFFSKERNFAGLARSLPLAIHFHARRAATRPDAFHEHARHAAAYLQLLRSVHSSLLFGNASEGLPGSLHRYAPVDALLFRKTCLNVDPGECAGAPELFASGLEALLLRFVEAAGLAAAAPGPEALPPSSPALRLLARANVPALQPALASLGDLYVEEGTARLRAFAGLQAAFFALILAALLLEYLFVFRRIVADLTDESRRTVFMFLMLPPRRAAGPRVIEATPAIKAHLSRLLARVAASDA